MELYIAFVVFDSSFHGFSMEAMAHSCHFFWIAMAYILDILAHRWNSSETVEANSISPYL